MLIGELRSDIGDRICHRTANTDDEVIAFLCCCANIAFPFFCNFTLEDALFKTEICRRSLVALTCKVHKAFHANTTGGDECYLEGFFFNYYFLLYHFLPWFFFYDCWFFCRGGCACGEY